MFTTEEFLTFLGIFLKTINQYDEEEQFRAAFMVTLSLLTTTTFLIFLIKMGVIDMKKSVTVAISATAIFGSLVVLSLVAWVHLLARHELNCVIDSAMMLLFLKFVGLVLYMALNQNWIVYGGAILHVMVVVGTTYRVVKRVKEKTVDPEANYPEAGEPKLSIMATTIQSHTQEAPITTTSRETTTMATTAKNSERHSVPATTLEIIPEESIAIETEIPEPSEGETRLRRPSRGSATSATTA